VSTRAARRPGWWLAGGRNLVARDIASGLLVTIVLTGGAYAEAHPRSPRDQVLNGHPVPVTPPAAFLLVAAACLVLMARRRYPLAVLAVSGSAVAAYSLLGYVNGAALLAPAIALFWVARAGTVRWTLVIAVLTLAGLVTATSAGDPFGPTGGGLYLIPGLLAVALFGGIAVRNRNAYVASIQARAEGEALRRVDEERLRIARELHDVVAHTMATINVQAGMAAHVLAEQPEVAAQALATIRTASKDGLRELRAILNVLRQADEGDPTQPAPGLAQLDALISGAGQAGLPVTLRRAGPARELPAPVDLTAYRIVQESLTNVIRHAGPATATIVISYETGALRIEVADTGIGPGPGPLAAAAPPGRRGPAADGYGLAGMRERAAAVGGVIEAGPGRGGGFRVTAWLPAPPQPGGWPGPAAAPAAGAPGSAPPGWPEPAPPGGPGPAAPSSPGGGAPALDPPARPAPPGWPEPAPPAAAEPAAPSGPADGAPTPGAPAGPAGLRAGEGGRR
jgi:signal transduction histidine kinase